MQTQLATSLESLARAESLLARWLDRLEVVDEPDPRAFKSLGFATRVMARLASIRKTLMTLQLGPATPRGRREARAIDDEIQSLFAQAHAHLAQLQQSLAPPGPPSPPASARNDNENFNDKSSPAAQNPLNLCAAPAPRLGGIRAIPAIPVLRRCALRNPFRAPAASGNPAPGAAPQFSMRRATYVRPLAHLAGWRAPDPAFFASLSANLESIQSLIVRQLDNANDNSSKNQPVADHSNENVPRDLNREAPLAPAAIDPGRLLSISPLPMPPPSPFPFWTFVRLTRPPRRHPPP